MSHSYIWNDSFNFFSPLLWTFLIYHFRLNSNNHIFTILLKWLHNFLIYSIIFYIFISSSILWSLYHSFILLYLLYAISSLFYSYTILIVKKPYTMNSSSCYRIFFFYIDLLLWYRRYLWLLLYYMILCIHLRLFIYHSWYMNNRIE